MLQKIKMLLLSFSALFMFTMPMVATAGVAYAITGVQEGVNANIDCGANIKFVDDPAATNTCPTTGAGKTLTDYVAEVINVISIVVGAVAVVMIIVGGFRYVASGGKDTAVAGAKTTIMYALIGLVVVALAQVIVRYVLTKASPNT